MITDTADQLVRHVTVQHLDLTYRLTEEELDSRPSFSISVSVTDNKTGKNENLTVHDITSEEEKALNIFRLIYEGSVTPITLRDIISDLLE